MQTTQSWESELDLGTSREGENPPPRALTGLKQTDPNGSEV